MVYVEEVLKTPIKYLFSNVNSSMIWFLVLSILSILFFYYFGWIGFSMVPSAMIFTTLLYFIPIVIPLFSASTTLPFIFFGIGMFSMILLIPLMNTAWIIPLVAPMMVLGLLCFTPLLSGFLIPLYLLFISMLAVLGAPLMAQTGIVLTMFICSGIILMMFGL